MLSFSLVTEALAGLIFHRPSGKNFSFPDCTSIILDAIHQSFVVDNDLFFFRVSHLKMRETRIHSLHKSLLTNGVILHPFDWPFEVTL